jgi:hypothetical protein
MPNNDDILTHVNIGDPVRLSASRENMVADATRDFERRQGIFERGRHALWRRGDVRIQNQTGANIPMLTVLGITTPAITPAQNQSQFEQRPILGGTNATTIYLGNWCVAAEAIPAGAIGEGWAFGVCPAMVNFTNGATFGWADVTVAGSVLTAAATTGGAQIVWSPQTTAAYTTGVVECLIRFVPGH